MRYAPLPTEPQLAALSRELAFRVVFERRIEGGLGCTTYVLRAGDRHLVLRRHGPWWNDRNPGVALMEQSVHTLVSEHGVPVPEVVWAAEPGVFHEPAILMQHIRGEDLLIPQDPFDAARQLATTLAAIHHVEPDGDTARLLRTPTSPDGDRPKGFFDHPDARRVTDRLAELRPAETESPALIHGDFWPGNTLWRDGSLVAVIDWEEASLGDPMNDVAYCALDLRYLGLDDAADVFIETYASGTGSSMETLGYWTLFALSRPMPDIAQWLPAWEAKGITHINADDLRMRHQELLEIALR